MKHLRILSQSSLSRRRKNPLLLQKSKKRLFSQSLLLRKQLYLRLQKKLRKKSPKSRLKLGS